VTETLDRKTLPGSVKLAAGLFIGYGVMTFVNTTAVLAAAGWAAPRGWLRATFHLLGSVLIAWGLLRRARWAWVLGLLLAGVWLFAGMVTTLVVEHWDVYWLPPSRFQLVLTASLFCLGSAASLLLTPSALAAFRRPAA